MSNFDEEGYQWNSDITVTVVQRTLVLQFAGGSVLQVGGNVWSEWRKNSQNALATVLSSLDSAGKTRYQIAAEASLNPDLVDIALHVLMCRGYAETVMCYGRTDLWYSRPRL
jgi:hypothetical protein